MLIRWGGGSSATSDPQAILGINRPNRARTYNRGVEGFLYCENRSAVRTMQDSSHFGYAFAAARCAFAPTTLKEKRLRIVHFESEGVAGIAADDGSGWHGLSAHDSRFPGALPDLIAQGADLLRIGRELLPMPESNLMPFEFCRRCQSRLIFVSGSTMMITSRRVGLKSRLIPKSSGVSRPA